VFTAITGNGQRDVRERQGDGSAYRRTAGPWTITGCRPRPATLYDNALADSFVDSFNPDLIVDASGAVEPSWSSRTFHSRARLGRD
jgi:hypothetical protein